MSQFLRIAVLYIVIAIFYTGIFILSLRSPVAGDLPLFFRGVLFIVTTAIVGLIAGILIIRRGESASRLESVFAAIVLAASLNFSFFVVVPVTLDRSVTTFLLASMSARGAEEGGFSKSELQDILQREYLTRFDAVGRRMDEQILSGNVHSSGDGKYALTEQGREFLAFANMIAKIYGIPPRYITAASGPAAN